MVLRYREKDEIDRLASEERGTPKLIFVAVFFALVDGVGAVLTGESLRSYGQGLALLLLCGFVFWMLSPIYFEFRIRIKETDGKVNTILQQLESIQGELDERLGAIEQKLNSVEDRLDERDSNGERTNHSSLRELTSIQRGLQHLNKIERDI